MFASSGVVVVTDDGRRTCADVDLDVTAVGGRTGGDIGLAVRSGADAAAIEVEGRASGGGGVDVNVSVVGRRAGGGVDSSVSRQPGG